MRVETNRFGPVEVDEKAILTFTQPIIGFPQHRRYALLPGPAGSPVKWLQSTDGGDLAFLVMDPRSAVADYAMELAPGELEELGVERVEDLEVYTLVVVPRDRTQLRTNLKAPILINPKKRLAKQTILERSGYPIQFFLAQAREGRS